MASLSLPAPAPAAETGRQFSAALCSILRAGCLRGDGADDDTAELVAETVLEGLREAGPSLFLSTAREKAIKAEDRLREARWLHVGGRLLRVPEALPEMLAEMLVDAVVGYVEDTDELMEGWDESEVRDNVDDLLDAHADWVLDVCAGRECGDGEDTNPRFAGDLCLARLEEDGQWHAAYLVSVATILPSSSEGKPTHGGQGEADSSWEKTKKSKTNEKKKKRKKKKKKKEEEEEGEGEDDDSDAEFRTLQVVTVRFEEFPTLVRPLTRDQIRFEDQLSADAKQEWGFGGSTNDDADVDTVLQSQFFRSGETGMCGICARHILLTAHHLIPKSEHKRRPESRAFLRGPENILMCCRPCHSQIHRAETNFTLAQDYDTREKIRSHPKIRAFARWVGKQSGKALRVR
jgi:5-methylcytosine-specific restriction endonuclease McrA